MRNPTKYTLQELMGWEEFEDLCVSYLYLNGYKSIRQVGGRKDKGRDAVTIVNQEQKMVFQISMEKEPLRYKSSKFLREYKKWAGKIDNFVFVSNRQLDASKIDLELELKDPSAKLFDITDLVNFLDHDPEGKQLKKKYAIFAKDLQEVFGAEDQLKKLSEVGQVINNDEHYNIVTVLSQQQDLKIPGAVFSESDGTTTRAYVPKSLEHFEKARPVGTFKIVAPKSDAIWEKFDSYIQRGDPLLIPSRYVKDMDFRIGDRSLLPKEGEFRISFKPKISGRVVSHILRSKEDPTIFTRIDMSLVKQGKDETLFRSLSDGSPYKLSLNYILSTKEVRVSYELLGEKCLDVRQAYDYLRLLNEFPLDLVVDDSGIERFLGSVPAPRGFKLQPTYLETIRKMNQIQAVLKVRLPNPLSKALTAQDVWSINRMYELVTDGKTSVKIPQVSYVVPDSTASQMIEQQSKDGILALAFRSEEPFAPMAIMGVSNFGMLEVVMPEARLTINPLGDTGQSRVIAEPVDGNAYIRSVNE